MSLKGKIRPLHDDIIVSDMNFGEQTLKSGIVIKSDDGKAHGVKSRWGKVYAVGNKRTDVKVGQWILLEHGRWTRGFDFEEPDGTVVTLRKADTKAMLAISDEEPKDVYIGEEYDASPPTTHRPEDFM